MERPRRGVLEIAAADGFGTDHLCGDSAMPLYSPSAPLSPGGNIPPTPTPTQTHTRRCNGTTAIGRGRRASQPVRASLYDPVRSDV